MTGHTTPVAFLRPHQIVHLEPHEVHGQQVGHGVTDVEVECVHFGDDDSCGCEAVIWWRSCARFPGARGCLVGATAYHHDALVLVIGQAGNEVAA